LIFRHAKSRSPIITLGMMVCSSPNTDIAIIDCMEIVVAIIVGITIAAAAGRRKRRHENTPARPETPEERKRREADELITVVLPTINSDK